MGDGDVKLQRKMQVNLTMPFVFITKTTYIENSLVLKVRRVQKYVETLDVLKIKNENQTPMQVQERNSDAKRAPDHRDRHPLEPSTEDLSTSETVVTTRWEIFDAMPPLVATSSSSSIPAAGNSSSHVQPKFSWEFFDWKIWLCIIIIIVWCVIELCYFFCWFAFSFFFYSFVYLALLRTIPFVINFNKWVSF